MTRGLVDPRDPYDEGGASRATGRQFRRNTKDFEQRFATIAAQQTAARRASRDHGKYGRDTVRNLHVKRLPKHARLVLAVARAV
jgi:hypothetical protein